MGRGSTVALALAAATLLVSLPMLLLVSLRPADPYEQETRRMFVEWKARVKETYNHAGEDECRYAVFKNTRRDVARARAARPAAARPTSSHGLNNFAATTIEEFNLMHVFQGDEAYEQETRRVFVGWKARYGKTYRDAGEEECRYALFKGNRRVIVRLNTAAGRNVYGLNQLGDLTNEEVCERCYPKIMEDRELSARCQADPDTSHRRLIRYQVCRCIAMELKETESRGSAILEDGAHMFLLIDF